MVSIANWIDQLQEHEFSACLEMFVGTGGCEVRGVSWGIGALRSEDAWLVDDRDYAIGGD